MISFEQIWQLLYQHGASEKKREGTERYWRTLSADQQHQVFSTISNKLREGKFVQYDPIRAMRENLYRPLRKTLTYQEYYERYGTTEPQDGWHMENPTGHQVIFVKP